MTADETHAPRRGKRVAASEAPPASETPPVSSLASLPLQPEALARALRAVAMELERDPALAERVAHAINAAPTPPATQATPTPPAAPRAASADEPVAPTIGRHFRPTIVTGVAETLGPGVPAWAGPSWRPEQAERRRKAARAHPGGDAQRARLRNWRLPSFVLPLGFDSVAAQQV
jgi:hypothetical protein